MSKKGEDKQPKRWPISVRLLKEGIKVVEITKKSNLRKVNEFDLNNCELWVSKPRDAKVPEWVELLDVPDNYKLKNKNSSALLFVTLKNDRIMVLSFGSGFMSIKDKYIVDSFGLRTVLNNVDEKTLRSIDMFTPDAKVTQKRVQKGDFSNFREFELDKDRELLKRITGNSINKEFSSSMTGSDSLNLRCELTRDKIIDKCEEIYKIYLKDDYKKDFSWIDDVKQVTDERLINHLEEHVLDKLNKALSKSTSPDFSVTFPKIIDFEKISYIKYGGLHSSMEFDHLNTDTLLDALREKCIDKLDKKQLTKITVKYHDSDTDKLTSGWSLLRCIVSEQIYEGDTYLSFSGKWYKIEKNFYERINNDFNKIMDDSIPVKDFPEFDEKIDFITITNKKGKTINKSSENKYNARIANVLKMELMDCKFVNNIEVCDLLDEDKNMIHVKRWAGSATFSHLLNQGLVSSQTIKESESFRNAIIANFPNSKIVKQTFSKDKPVASDFHVHFAIIDERKTRKNTLPFFSKLSLVNTHKNINLRMNMNMHVWWIDAKQN